MAPLLEAGLSTLALEATAAQRAQLLAYLGLLQRWNRVYNLTALRERDDMVSHHLLDCLAVVPRLAAHAEAGPLASKPPVDAGGDTGGFATEVAAVPGDGQVPGVEPQDHRSLRILDVGSGGGLPGVVLAICRPDWQVTCVDTVAKKASFIRQAAAELRLPNLRAEHARVEQLAAKGGHRFEVITARAFSSLPDLVALTRDLLAAGGCWMAMKGAVPDDEIAQLPADVDVFHVEQLAVPGLDARRCLVWMRLKSPGG